MKIRKYHKKDRQQIIDLWKNTFPIYSPHNDPEQSLKRKISYDKNFFFVADDNNKIIGTVMGCYDGHRGWIYSLAVKKDYRNRGIGKLLMERVENELKKYNCPKVNLQVHGENKGVVGFYKKIGYAIEDRVSMGKKLY